MSAFEEAMREMTAANRMGGPSVSSAENIKRRREATKAAMLAAKPQPDQPAQEQARQSPQDQVKDKQ